MKNIIFYFWWASLPLQTSKQARSYFGKDISGSSPWPLPPTTLKTHWQIQAYVRNLVKVQGDATSANEVTVKISKVLDSSKLNVKAGWSHCQALSSTFLKEAQTCFFVVNGTFGTEDKDRKGKRHCRKNLAVLFALKTLDTIDNCQSPVFSLCVSQHAQNNNLWKFELNWSSKLQEDNGGKNTLVNQVVYFQTLDFETSNQILRSQNQIQIF